MKASIILQKPKAGTQTQCVQCTIITPQHSKIDHYAVVLKPFIIKIFATKGISAVSKIKVRVLTTIGIIGFAGVITAQLNFR